MDMMGNGSGMVGNGSGMAPGNMMGGRPTFPPIPEECLPFGLHDNPVERCRGFRGSRIAVGCLSMIACILVLVAIVILRRYKTFAQRMVLYLFICTAFHSLHYIWSDYKVTENVLEEALPDGIPPEFGGRIAPVSDYGRWCRFQGYFAIITSWYIILWLLSMGLHMLWTGLWEQQSGRFIETLSIAVNLLVATFFAHVPFLYDAYGPIALYCWIVNRIPGETTLYRPGPFLQYIVYYIPIGSICLATIIITVAAPMLVRLKLSMIHGPRAELLKDFMKNDIVPLIPYPWLFAASYVFPLINRIRISAQDDPREDEEGHFALWYLDGVTAASVGFLFAIGFILNKQVWRDAKDLMKRMMGYSRRNGNEYSEQHELKSPK